VLRIAILGAESTGKTSLVRAMAEQLRGQGARVEVIEEVLRRWCQDRRRTPHAHEQADIVQTQIGLVDAASSCDYLLCDTTPLMTAIYSDLLFSDATLYPVAVQQQRRYALNLLAEPDLPWQPDGLQRDGVATQKCVDQRLREALQTFAISSVAVQGVGAQRLACAMAAIGHFQEMAR
jgi:nicotinamide riboside kinase